MSIFKGKSISGRERAFQFGTRGRVGRDSAANAGLMATMGIMVPNKTLDRFFDKHQDQSRNEQDPSQQA